MKLKFIDAVVYVKGREKRTWLRNLLLDDERERMYRARHQNPNKSNNSLSWQLQRASLMCTICIESPPRQFDALLARLHQQSMLIFATIALGHPKSAFEPFQRLQGSSRCVLSSDSSSLAYWNLRWTVLKPYILPQRHKQWISGIQRTELFPLLSARREGLR